MLTVDTITNDMIARLQDESIAIGGDETARICRVALHGVTMKNRRGKFMQARFGETYERARARVAEILNQRAKESA